MLRIGIIGTNIISDRFIDAAKKLNGVSVTAVFSRTHESGNAFAKRHDIEKVYTDLSAFAASNALDAAYVASPNLCHAAQSTLLLSHKKHVLCEKPLTATHAEFSAVRNAAKENACVLLEAMRPVFTPTYERIRAWLPEIGRIRSAFFNFCQYSSRYDRFLNGEILNAFNPALANAALLDIGVYPVHVMLSLFGMPKDAKSHSVFLENGFEGAGHILCAYDGFHATVSYSKIHGSSLASVIEGEKGCVTVSAMNAFDTVTLATRDGRKESFTNDTENNMIYELSAFRDAVNGTRDVSAFLDTSDAVSRFLDGIRAQNGIVFPCDE